MTLTPLEQAALRTALVKLTDVSSSFYISTFDQMCKVYGVLPDPRDHEALRLLHCVSWSAMDKETRKLATEAILRTFGAPQAVIAEYQEVSTSPHRSADANGDSAKRSTFFQRLLGAGR